GHAATPAAPTPDPAAAPARIPTQRPQEHHDETLDEVVRRRIEAALADCLGRIEGPFGAARRLGINPHTLRARMRRLGIDWTRFRPPRA
ncbi:helix-turn-helix domain-containing protein, partial [Thiococcus pfennigii]